MNKWIALLLLTISINATAKEKNLERPKLVVGIVVDQMRWDYLYRYYERYGNDGFKRLLQEGFSCEQTMINYLPSFTAPGHSCIYTGSVPSIHGIAGNDWIDNLTGRKWYCTEDTTVTPVGGSKAAGMMSPRNLLASTITDELRLATNFQSRVFGFSLKDRGAILPAGHLANGAYWFDDSTGNFMSSSFYSAQLPAWLQEINNRKLANAYLQKVWQLMYPANTYTQSLPDNNIFEGKFSGEIAPVFPHVFKAPFNYNNLRKIPAGNTFTFDAAKACVEGEKMGTRTSIDFLCISLSATDYIGHQFTPNSMEAEDCYLRLDKDLANFLSYLDQNVGKGNYLVFLTADHGAAHNPEYLKSISMNAGMDNETGVYAQLNTYLKQELKHDSLMMGVENYQVFLNRNKIATSGLGEELVKDKIINWFKSQPQIAYVVDMDNLNKTPLPDAIKTKIINGYNRERSGQILLIQNPGWYHGYAATGTTHGTWNPYDTHIPLLWYGWHIAKGASNTTVYMEDITATLAALLHIQMPNGCIGKPIEAVVK